MTGLVLRNKSAIRARLTLSHVPAAGGTAKTRAGRAFVSGVSPVPPYLKLINEYRMGNEGRQEEGINSRSALGAGTGGTGATVSAI
jgi:hypothetical protein